MTDETIGGPADSIASHCAEKSGGVASPASDATGGPQPARNARTRASCSGSRLGAGSGIQMLSWNAPAEGGGDRLGSFRGRVHGSLFVTPDLYAFGDPPAGINPI